MLCVGVGAVLAKLGSTAKPTMFISVDDDVWKLRTETTFKTHEISFKLDQEFDETTPDGRKVRVRIITPVMGGKLKDNATRCCFGAVTGSFHAV